MVDCGLWDYLIYRKGAGRKKRIDSGQNNKGKSHFGGSFGIRRNHNRFIVVFVS